MWRSGRRFMRKNYYPIALELEYGKLWASVVAKVCKNFCLSVLQAGKEIAAAATSALSADRQAERADSQDALRYDEPTLAEVLAFINELKEKEGSRINTAVLKSHIKKQLKLIDAWSRSKTSEVLQRNITRLTMPQPAEGQAVELLMQFVNLHRGVSEEFIDAAVDKNVGLIKQLLGASLDSIAAVAKESFVAGEGHAALTKRLMTQAGAVEKKAKFWARDQASKFFGAVTKERQTKAGLPGYVWRTMEDQRVRDRHQHVNGKYFEWKNPPAAGTNGEHIHPGDDYNCRCWAEPAFGPEYADVMALQHPSISSGKPTQGTPLQPTSAGTSETKAKGKTEEFPEAERSISSAVSIDILEITDTDKKIVQGVKNALTFFDEKGIKASPLMKEQLSIKQAALSEADARYVFNQWKQEIQEQWIEIAANCETPNITTIHELSHWLDHLCFGDGITFGSSSKSYEPIRKAIEKTAEYKQLKAIQEKGKKIKVKGEYEYQYEFNGRTETMPEKALDYYLDPTEQFAMLMEAYSAYDAGGDFAKEMEIQRELLKGHFGFDLYPTEKELKSISKKLSKYLKRK